MAHDLTPALAAAPIEVLIGADFPALRANYAIWKDKSSKATAALTAIQAIENDEQDAHAQSILVKCRNTYELINEGRTTYTKVLDSAKSELMEPERAINPDPKQNNEYARVRKMRDAYNQAKLVKQQEEQERIRKEQARKDELTRLKTMLEIRFVENVAKSVQSLEGSLNNWMQGITLDTFGSAVAALNVKPNLKKDVFEGWFAVQYNTAVVPVDSFNDFMRQVRENYTYDKVNGLYQQHAAATVETYKNKLPGLKVDLERIAALNAEQAKEAEEKLKKEQQDEANARQAALALETQSKVNQAEQQGAMARLDNAFDTNVALQEVQTELKGVRKIKRAVITCAPSLMVATLSKVLFAMFTSTEFGGITKRNPDGSEKVDDNGIPVYVDWLQEILNFYASKCSEAGIEGIELRELVATVQRAQR